jgi:folate-binding protein YgfZ
MTLHTTALRLTGRDVLPLLHRTTSNALADLALGQARATLFCDFRGRLLYRAVVAAAPDGAIWLLRPDASGAALAAAVDRMVFRDDVRIEDLSAAIHVRLVPASEPGPAAVFRADASAVPVPVRVATGDGTALETGDGDTLGEAARIALLHPRHGHEIAEVFNPFEVGLAHEVHLAKGCFTGQEGLQRLITYGSVRRRPAHVRLSESLDAVAEQLPCEVFAAGERAGVLTSVAGRDGFAVLKQDALQQGAPFTLENGTMLEVLSAPELARPLGRT